MKKENYIKEKELSNMPKGIPYETLKILFQKMETQICKIECNDSGHGTGFFCNIPYEWNAYLKVLMTNNHVLNINDISFGKKIKFSLNNEKIHYEIELDNSRKIYTNEDYDITIIEIKQNDNIDENAFFDIDKEIFKENPNDIFRNKQIYLLHYPKGEQMVFSNGIIKNIYEDNYTIQHLCDSSGGSSGGPLINTNYQVIGIHKGGAENGKNYNLGTLLKLPIEEFKRKTIIKAFSKPERKRNIDTLLNKIKMKSIDISDALLLYNEEILDACNCELLIPIIPEEEEYDEISKKTERLEDENDFDECDLFIVLIGCILNSRERLEAILFRNRYSKKAG
jgi:hypothetical protein